MPKIIDPTAEMHNISAAPSTYDGPRRVRSAATTEIGTLDQHKLDCWANRIARMLLRRGAHPGAHIATAELPVLEGAVTRWAITKIGAIPVSAASGPLRDRAGIGVTTRARRPEPDTVSWLVLDDHSTLVEYLTGSDAPITDAELGVTRQAC
ncbi:hypothetical protein ABIA39_000736 [Nocardia sp. GAS34]|jgi:hypothetical protein|uniref:AMP-binding protein n=1 Tax=unclassified Nocardia TaxID=2637762 RepID=UPI003D1B4970